MHLAFLNLSVFAELFGEFGGSLENRTNGILNPYLELVAFLWQRLKDMISNEF